MPPDSKPPSTIGDIDDMARIRTAKPSWWSDPLLALIDRDTRFTYRGLIECCADDEGRFKADPRIVKGKVWPLDDDLTTEWVAGAMRRLEELGKSDVDDEPELGRIVLYVHRQVPYGWIPRFNKHQYIANPTPTQLPAPPAAALAFAEPHVRRKIPGTKLSVIDARAGDAPKNPPKIDDHLGGKVHEEFPRTALAIGSKKLVRELLIACTDNLNSVLRKQAFARSILEAAENALRRGFDPEAVAIAATDYLGALASGKETPHISRWRGYITNAHNHLGTPRRGQKADGDRTSGKFRYKASTREARI